MGNTAFHLSGSDAGHTAPCVLHSHLPWLLGHGRRPVGEEGVQRLAGGPRPDLDQLVRQALLVLSSDWAFMVTRWLP